MNISKRSSVALAAGLAVIIIAGIFWFTDQKTEVANLDSKGASIVAFGDSLVYGYGSTSGHDFASLLSARIGLPIANKGHSGDTTAAALARLDEVLDEDPRIVIVLLGGNDFLRKVPMDETFANLDKIVSAIQARGSAVLLLGVRGGLLSDSYADRFSEFAKSHRAAFVPNVLDGLLGHREYMFDQIHPNDAGYAKIADKIEPVLKDMLRRR